ncbi:hypothetical protein DB30_07778 [Enhygromyxa salina]|uniref:Lipoprotein n=1 Tax=Enhygromyxa salina TaxID=215803 RepID=A0A0C2A5V7_9BACT|nr:hypothetical protein [Enhygromyxa salina]KIG18763.1 hypothetical protein DB30_07778 [Enhygromyxa salina]
MLGSKAAFSSALLIAAGLASTTACGTKRPDRVVVTGERANPQTKPAAKPERAKVALSITLTRKPGDLDAPFELSATAPPLADPLSGLEKSWSCRSTESVPPPCGWAKLCGELGRRWADQLLATDIGNELARHGYQEDCGDDGDLPEQSSSGDFVDHAAVIRHQTDALAEDGVAELVVQTQAGWQPVARIREVAVEGMSVARVHQPWKSWQLETDGHPGDELVLLVTGTQTGADDPVLFARAVVCHVSPKPECRRIELSRAKTLELLVDGTFSVDGDAPVAFDALQGADQMLITTLPDGGH